MLDIYVINLEERQDRFEKIKDTFKNFNIIRIDAIKHEKGYIGCFLSHLECIKIAKENNLKNILVIEDDCIPYYTENNFESRLIKIKNILDNRDDWDIFLGCSSRYFDSSIISYIIIDDEKFVKTSFSYTTNMICYNSKIYDFFLNAIINVPIDLYWNSKIIAFLSVPFIATQDEGYSNIAKKKISLKHKIVSCNDNLLQYDGPWKCII